jgi:hypothetical protein
LGNHLLWERELRSANHQTSGPKVGLVNRHSERQVSLKQQASPPLGNPALALPLSQHQEELRPLALHQLPRPSAKSSSNSNRNKTLYLANPPPLQTHSENPHSNKHRRASANRLAADSGSLSSHN